MLALSRRPNDDIVLRVPGLGQEIDLKVLRTQSRTVRPGVTGPSNLTIFRGVVREP